MNAARFLAIDPGCSGALVVLDSSGEHIDHLLMPVIKIGKSSRVNAAAVSAFVASHEPVHCFIEKVHSMPSQGVSSTFTFGHSAGVVEGVVAGIGVPITLVTPQAWKKHAGLIGSDKDAARSRAVQLFPGLRVLDLKGKGQAVADALLIGRYGVSGVSAIVDGGA